MTLKLVVLPLLSPARVAPSDAEAVSARMRGTWSGATALVVLLVLRMARCQDVPLVPGKTSSGLVIVIAVSLIRDSDLLTRLHPLNCGFSFISVQLSDRLGLDTYCLTSMKPLLFYFLVLQNGNSDGSVLVSIAMH